MIVKTYGEMIVKTYGEMTVMAQSGDENSLSAATMGPDTCGGTRGRQQSPRHTSKRQLGVQSA